MTSSPTFIARFADGEVTRMTTYHDDERKALDVERGVRLARWAYVSRKKWAYVSRKKRESLMIESASFERRLDDGGSETLATYTADQIEEVSPRASFELPA
jgi:hypothetical protein